MAQLINAPVIEKHNVLPHSHKSWLEFYDSISAEYKVESVLTTKYGLSTDDVYHYEQRHAPLGENWVIKIDREYLLARLGEELLPSRLKRRDIDSLLQGLHNASRYTTEFNFDSAITMLERVSTVAKRN